MSHARKRALLGLELRELIALAEQSGEPKFRGQQLFQALYRERSSSLNEVSTLSAAFRRQLEEGYTVGMPHVQTKVASSDGTVRYLLGFDDAQSVETVWMPEGDGGEAGDGSATDHRTQSSASWNRATICISSQVGCAVDCQFCLTALLGVQRNLTAGEIVGQVTLVLKDQQIFPPTNRVNLVFMGMGEPFLNYENFMTAVRLLVQGVGIPESRMTVSTAGIVPRIRDFAAEPVRPKLAISLNAANDGLRSRLMPINRKWSLEELMGAARGFPLRPREKLTFEYVLLAEVNDSAEDARGLVKLVHGMRAKVNLIAFNPGPGVEFRTPPDLQVSEFQKILNQAGVPAFIRRPRGRDIYAACGQLKRTLQLTPTP